MPPELLHMSGSGLIMYMFESLRLHLGGGIDWDYIDHEHIVVSNIIQRQSERDFPSGLMHNGLIDGTKIQSTKRKGNLFWFLCIAHRTKAKTILKNSLQLSDVRWRKFIHLFKSYLAMEEWFHGSNDKDKVHNARDEIAKVLTSLQFFPKIRSHKWLQHTQNAWNNKNAVIHQAFWEWNKFLLRTGWSSSQDLCQVSWSKSTKTGQKICSTNCTPTL